MDMLISSLADIGGNAIAQHANVGNELHSWGRIGRQLADLLTLKNGFYAYESALLVRPLQCAGVPMGLLEWNLPTLWKSDYGGDLADALFFAEDVFGGQYGIRNDTICTFDPETGNSKVVSSSLGEWAEIMLSDYEYQTGYLLSKQWQLANGALPPGTRLLPKVPFFCGGKFAVENLYAVNDAKGMLFRASIASQVRALPDGTKIVLRIGKAVPPVK